MTIPVLVPELDVSDLARSLDFYVGLIGFEVLYERPEERFAYLTLGDAHLMLEEAAGPGRRFRTAPLERPYGRGVNFQISGGGRGRAPRTDPCGRSDPVPSAGRALVSAG